jgi:hypothetical protein
VPHVPGAFLFDLNVGDGRVRPTREMGWQAASEAAGGVIAEGSVGAGTGASVGKIHGIARAMRGGIGSTSVRLDGGLIVGALVAVNALGDVRDPDTGALDRRHARQRERPATDRLRAHARQRRGARPVRRAQPHDDRRGATNARLTKSEAAKVASLGMLGLREGALAAAHRLRRRHALRALGPATSPRTSRGWDWRPPTRSPAHRARRAAATSRPTCPPPAISSSSRARSGTTRRPEARAARTNGGAEPAALEACRERPSATWPSMRASHIPAQA